MLLKLEDLPDDPSPEQIRQLDRASLDLIPYERRRWICQCKGCTNSTGIRDYGMAPFYWLDRGSKRSHQEPNRYWYNLELWRYTCPKHHKFRKRLMQLYAYDKVEEKLIDRNKQRIITTNKTLPGKRQK